MNEQQRKRSIFNVLVYNIPGARESITLLFLVLTIFMVAAGISAYLFVKAVQVGRYAEVILAQNLYIIFGIWVLLWAVSFIYAMQSSLRISHRVAGPIKRLEHTLDEIISGKDATLSVRKGDALDGIVQRVNKLVAMHKEKLAGDQKAAYEAYQKKTEEMERKTRNL
jgi:type VI protein secretion system component VasK